jgi:hypothetical protein
VPDFTVHAYGTDSSGRTIYMTAFMHDWYEARCAAVGFRPTIVQGGFMTRNGGGAADSSGAHDQGGCIDVRTRDLTEAQIDAWVRETRDHGGATYRRDLTPKHGGMDPHAHTTLGADRPLSAMAHLLWASYVAGGDGLAAGPGRPSGAPDYEYRPNPLVLTPPPEDDMTPDQDRTLSEIAATVARLEKRGIRQTQRVMAAIRAARKQVKASDTQVLAALDDVEKALADDA